jgi:hypothetical protein
MRQERRMRTNKERETLSSRGPQPLLGEDHPALWTSAEGAGPVGAVHSGSHEGGVLVRVHRAGGHQVYRDVV